MVVRVVMTLQGSAPAKEELLTLDAMKQELALFLSGIVQKNRS